MLFIEFEVLGKFSSLSIGIIKSEYVCGGQSPNITNDFFPDYKELLELIFLIIIKW